MKNKLVKLLLVVPFAIFIFYLLINSNKYDKEINIKLDSNNLTYIYKSINPKIITDLNFIVKSIKYKGLGKVEIFISSEEEKYKDSYYFGGFIFNEESYNINYIIKKAGDFYGPELLIIKFTPLSKNASIKLNLKVNF